MDKNNEKAFLRFAEFLSSQGAASDPERDIRQHMLALRNRPLGIGYAQDNLAGGFAANMARLFPKAVSFEDGAFPAADAFLLSGTVYRDSQHSHKGAVQSLGRMPSGRETILFEMAFLASSHSWSHGFREKKPEIACLGYVFDDLAYYFMADYQSRINRKLNSAEEITETERLRARALIDRIVRERISKYNAQPMCAPVADEGYSRRVLVCDQSYGDASTVYGKMDEADYERMLLAAIAENPDAEIWVKSHPDTAWEKDKRAGYYSHLQSSGRVRILREPMNPFLLFDLVDTVYVGTSQMGLEALLAGKKVVTFGAPFYGGWGLTEDRKKIPHRHRYRDLESLFHYFYIWYSIYCVPGRPIPSQIEDALDHIVLHRPYSLPPSPAPSSAPPKVSVILPVHNVEKYLEKALRSAMEQSLQEIEIIAVNDCSPDRSQDIIERLAAEDPRIRPVTMSQNSGQGFARNKGIDLARGEYLWFLDSDDWFTDRNFLRDIVAVADANQSQMVRAKKSAEAVFDVNDNFLHERPDPGEAYFTQDIGVTNFAEHFELSHNRHFWTWLYRRDYLNEREIRFTTAQWEERPFLLKALLGADRLSLTTRPAVTYRVRRNSTARRAKTPADAESFLQNFETVGDLLCAHGAADRQSPLRPHLDFQMTQYLHYLFLGFWYPTLQSAGSAPLESGLARVAQVLRKCDFTSADVSKAPQALSLPHVRNDAYGLLAAALRSGRWDLIDKAIVSRPVAQKELHALYLTPPESPEASDLLRALNLYARNHLVKSAGHGAGPGGKLSRPRIILHIGSTKTGSTTLQNLMSDHRPELLRKGIWYPEIGLFWQKDRPHKQAGHAEFTPAAVADRADLRHQIEAGLAHLPHVHTIVLSSEAFFLNRNAARIVGYFKDYPVEMVAYLRRQDEWAGSQYAEFVAGGAVGRVEEPFAAWLDRDEVRAWLDYEALYRHWRRVLPEERIHMRIYGGLDAEKNASWDVLRDFAEVTGLPELLDLPVPEKHKRNAERLSTAHVELLRRYGNADFADREAYFRFIEEVTTGLNTWRASKAMPMPGPWFLTDELSRRIMAAAEPGNAALAAHIAGAEADLFPRRAAPPEPTGIHVEELALIDAAFARHRRPERRRAHPVAGAATQARDAFAQEARRDGEIVNYGLFGWRYWLLTPMIDHLLFKRRVGPDLRAQYRKEPADFARKYWSTNRPMMTRMFYPEGNVLGPRNMLRIWVPLLEPFFARRGGRRAVTALHEDPVRLMRSLNQPLNRIIGRILFPLGELRPRARKP
ncbi:glycosyltransferase [Paracoccus ravus]|uniref:glycosyltransferase n=1 Tax=Paracoccus ravus TaxID=2447760 RepID=UPI00106EDD44|nr:glycosyltransferase [Paracoccus ravus]